MTGRLPRPRAVIYEDLRDIPRLRAREATNETTRELVLQLVDRRVDRLLDELLLHRVPA